MSSLNNLSSYLPDVICGQGLGEAVKCLNLVAGVVAIQAIVTELQASLIRQACFHDLPRAGMAAEHAHSAARSTGSRFK